MNDTPREQERLADTLEKLADSFSEIARLQREALLSGDLQVLWKLTEQRGEVFDTLRDTVELARDKILPGDAVLENKLANMSREVLAIDQQTIPTLQQWMRQVGMDLEKIRQGRLAVGYQRRTDRTTSSTVNIIR